MRLSLRAQLGLVLIFVNVAATAVVALLAYQAAHDALMNEAYRRVAQAARGRATALEAFVSARQHRLEGFLQSVESLCGERGPTGRFGWEDECVRIAVGGFSRAEGATAAELRYRGRRIAGRRSRLPWRTGEVPGLAIVRPLEGRNDYRMTAARGELVVRAAFPLRDLDEIFSDRGALDVNGELFLTDGAGHRLTAVNRAAADGFPIVRQVPAACGSGTAAATGRTIDDRGVSVITGLQRTSATGGGCVVANLTYDAATAPIRRLTSLFVFATVAVMLAGVLVSAVAAGMAARPINRLVASARELAAGHFDTAVHEGGPAEVRHLAQTLSRMAASIRDLVSREQQARRDAESANQMKDTFLATLSHELRTPLNAILGWSTILMRGPYDEARARQAVRVIERNARIQSQMIEELLDVTRIAAGNMRLSLGDVALAPAVDAALDAIGPTAELKSVSLHRHLAAQTRAVRADVGRLQQILWNLLSNAVRFTPSGGRVDVIVRDNGSDVEIVVADTGSGISEALLPHVFERFRQGDSGTTRAHGGLGLGLAIVRDLVELHGGTVEAHSEGEGRGATFIVRLPAATTASRIEQAAARGPGPQRLAGARVLVVDDDPDAREVLRAILEDAGAEVRTTASARESRAVFAQSHPDLLIADIGMPEEDGYSLIRSIRRLESGAEHIPAIALTAHSRPEDIDQALASGFQLHIAKPIDSTRLISSVATLVARAC